ncbi:hypothetical protein AB1Y20_021401 [Prymnesium parvum]|uniref:Uncharacterized protein n=1 Tax=Prymnesium parvum TaxID=97485 RepID=A0AB34JLX4_PRYPA
MACKVLRPESLSTAEAEQFSAYARAWPTLCQGDNVSLYPDASCADEPFDAARYSSVGSLTSAYAAFHAYSLSTQKPEGSLKTLFYVPNQYGFGNRLRSLKSALLIAMLTGRVFFIDWSEPYPVHMLLRPAQIDWRLETLEALTDVKAHRAGAQVLCLPFGAQHARTTGHNCQRGLSSVQREDLTRAWTADALEVHSFTDLNIYLANNPYYEPLLTRLGRECPKRMGCLYRFLFSAQPVVQERLDAISPPGAPGHIGVQVRNRLWLQDSHRIRVSNAGDRIVSCLAAWVPPNENVFFTSDDDSLYAAAQKRWGSRLRLQQGKVYQAWSQGSAIDASKLKDDDEEAVLKAVVDWFALEASTSIIYTTGSSFGKTAAESSSVVNIDLNHTKCRAHAAAGRDWSNAWPTDPSAVSYDTSLVPGAKGSSF